MPSDAIIIDLSHSTDDESCKEGLPLLKGVGDTLHQQKALIHLTNDEESGAPTLPSWFSTSPLKENPSTPPQHLSPEKGKQSVASDVDLLASILSPHGFPRLSRSIGKPLDPVSRFNDISGSITVNQPAVATTATAPVSARTAALLADISGNERPPRKRILAGFNKTLSTANEMKKSRNRFVKAVPRASSMNPTNASVPSKRPCPSSAEISMKQKEREDSMIYKAKEREDLKARKKVERDEKARQKRLAADLAEVNKLKTDKKLSTLEMIVDLPFSIENSSTGTQIREYLQNLQIQTTSYSGPVPNVISWRRKVAAIFNESLGHWERVPETIRTEKHVLCLLTAREFTAMLVSDPANSDGVDVETHVMKMKSVFPGYTLIYIIEGLDVWLKKHKSMRNRAYQAAALNPAEDEVRHLHCGDHVSNPSQKNVVEALVDEDVVEDALLWLQVAHKCLVQQSAMTVETAEWIASFTQHISTIPYRGERTNVEVSFCMDVGQIKSGEDKEDTYIKMLQEIVRVTAPVAYGIAARYPTAISLLGAMKQYGPLVLEDIKKSANQNGSVTNMRIGPALSKRLYRIFMEADPSLMDI